MPRVSRPATKDHIDLPPFRGYKIRLYRRTDVQDSSLHMRVWLKAQDRYHRKALDTNDVKEATELAQHELTRVLTILDSGQTFTTVSVGQLIREYQKVLEGRLQLEDVRPDTHRNAVYRIGLAKKFLEQKLQDKAGLQTRLHSVDGSIFEHFLEWRKEDNPALRRDVVNQELLIIKRMFKWAVKKKYANDRCIPSWDFRVEKQKAKRPPIGLTECFDVLGLAFEWSKEETTIKQGYARSLMAHVLATINCSGMRTGECLNIKRKDVGPVYDKIMCDVRVIATNSKKQEERTITIGGLVSGPKGAIRNHNWLLYWMNALQLKYPDGTPANYDYVFSTGDGKHAENLFYKTYGEFREEVLKKHKLDHVDVYHQRHAFISDRLRVGIPAANIAIHCGTSIRMISQNYMHITGPESSREIISRPLIYK